MVCKILPLLTLIASVSGHGYMVHPPARNSMWRFGYKNPPNYSDNQLYCGGAARMKKNGGKCGVCGDAYDAKIQPHMDGGRYANDIIGETYNSGQVINIQVLLTASHKGYFEFRIGDFTNSRTSGNSIGKLSGVLLNLVNGGTRFPISKFGKNLYTIKLQLPQDLKCKRCVVQWWYRGGNSWGTDENGSGLGHGPQEHFVNCADVEVL